MNNPLPPPDQEGTYPDSTMNARQSLTSLAAAFSLLSAAVTPSCQTSAQTGTLAGAGAGALVGRAIDDDNRGRGAVIGSVIGAILGGIGGAAVDEQRARRFNEERYYREQQPYPPQQQPAYSQYPSYSPPPAYNQGNQGYRQPVPPRENFPTGTSVGRDRVRSPYPPNNVINTEGYPRGEIVVDPTTGKPFRIP